MYMMNGESETQLPPKPYLDMSPQEIQTAYSPSAWSSRNKTPEEIIQAHITTLLQESDKARNNLPFSLGISYGDTEKQKMDILMPDSLPRDCPIVLYIHGGYWQLLGREYSSFMALPIYEAEGAFIAVGYDQSPQVSLAEIVIQIKNAVKYVLNLAKHRESRAVFLCGHSAGAHLAAMMLSVDWMSEAHISSGLIKGVILLSGVFDVRPLMLTTENIALQLNESTAWECSPLRHLHDVSKFCRNTRVLVVVGGDESPEFIRQSQQYHQALEAIAVSSMYITWIGEDHFTLVEKLAQQTYSLTQKLLSWMDFSCKD